MQSKIVMDAINKVGDTQDKLLEVLIEVQAQAPGNYISETSLRDIAQGLNIPLSKAYSVAGFYSMLSTKERGKYLIQICNSGPCYINRGKAIAHAFEQVLGIRMGETTTDKLFTLEYTSCFGACDVAPAIKINDKVYGNLTVNRAIQIINDLKEGEK